MSIDTKKLYQTETIKALQNFSVSGVSFSVDLAKNIELLGFKDGSEKYAVFKQSKIIVHPAIFDSGGMAAAAK